MLLVIKNKIILVLQLIVVMFYIIFEALIWDGIAKPIYLFIHSLKMLQKLEQKLQTLNPFWLLLLFMMLLLLVEGFGVYAGVLFVSGQILFGLIVYLSKIPLAAFTFWLFRVSEAKLMEFKWFAWLYRKIIGAIDWLKSCEIYLKTMQRFHTVKKSTKGYIQRLKQRYFADKSLFVQKLEQIYHAIKGALKK